MHSYKAKIIDFPRFFLGNADDRWVKITEIRRIRSERMNNRSFTIAENKNYLRKRTNNLPDDFGDWSMEKRREWVSSEPNADNYELDKCLSILDIFNLSAGLIPWSRHYSLYQVLLVQYDPAEAEKYVSLSCHASFFLESYGLERARPFIASQCWLKVIDRSNTSILLSCTRDQIHHLLRWRGAEQVASTIKDKAMGLHFLDIFGLQSLSLLPNDLAKQIKGRHLENELWL